MNINTATHDELLEIRHIGEERAGAIIAGRPWERLSQLTQIEGIGESRLKDINEQNLACAGPVTQIMPTATPEPTDMPGEYLTVFGETKLVSTIVAEERARIEQHGYDLVCVSGMDVVRSLMSDPLMPDEARFLEIMEDLCEEYL